MTFSRKKVIAALKDLSVVLGFLFVVILLTIIEQIMRKDYSKNEAYIYVPAGQRAVFRYKDMKMYDCSWCHRTNSLNRHHIVPQAASPEMRDVPTNLIVLCRDCHFVLGHRCNWRQFNPDVSEIVNTYTNCIKSSEYYAENH